jgi:hypothetical protein
MCVVRVLFLSLGHGGRPNFSLPRLTDWSSVTSAYNLRQSHSNLSSVRFIDCYPFCSEPEVNLARIACELLPTRV